MAQDIPKLPTLLPQSSEKSDKEETLNLLNEEEVIEEKPKVREEKEEEKEEKEEEEPEEEEIKLVATEEEEPELELQVPFRRQEVLKKYPNLFKEFPFLEKSSYISKEFTELFGTLDDAKEVVEKAQQFDKYQEEIGSGNLEGIIRNIRETDEEAYGKLIDTYLPTLAKADPQAYYAVLGDVLRNTVISMANEGAKLENEKLREAALILNQFIFGTSDVPPARTARSQPNEAEQRLQQREQEFLRQRYETVHQDLSGRVDNILRSTISQHIDPKQSMTDYVRRNAIKDALERTQETIAQDMAFRKTIDSLWRKAFQSNFDKRSTDSIRAAYLGKAKSILPEMIKKVRNEALKGASKSTHEDNNPPISRGRSTSSTSNSGKKSSDIPKNMSSLDYLMQD